MKILKGLYAHQSSLGFDTLTCSSGGGGENGPTIRQGKMNTSSTSSMLNALSFNFEREGNETGFDRLRYPCDGSAETLDDFQMVDRSLQSRGVRGAGEVRLGSNHYRLED